MIGKRVSMLVAMSLAFVGVSALDASAGASAGTVKPNLAVVGTSVTIYPKNCEVDGAEVLSVAVRIKNTGGPLVALNGGTLRLMEVRGSGLSGDSVALRAFGAGQERSFILPVKARLHPGLLVGRHRFRVFLKPEYHREVPNNFDEPAPYDLYAVIPVGHCGGAVAPRADFRGVPPSAVGRPSSGVPLPLPRDLRSTCPDLAASRIDFSIVSRRDPYHGRVSIVGVVKNVGTTAYESGPTQQTVQLYEGPYFGLPTGRRLVAQQAFQNLAPGQEISVRYERDWYSASPAEGEFPPSYTVMISYDPDIGHDSNPKNNDCVNTNNMKERNGDDINGLFRR